MNKTDRRIVRPADIARMLGRSTRTVHNYRAQGIIPPPDLVLAGCPAWYIETIERALQQHRAPRATGQNHHDAAPPEAA